VDNEGGQSARVIRKFNCTCRCRVQDFNPSGRTQVPPNSLQPSSPSRTGNRAYRILGDTETFGRESTVDPRPVNRVIQTTPGHQRTPAIGARWAGPCGPPAGATSRAPGPEGQNSAFAQVSMH
jgi:hypothetical protein